MKHLRLLALIITALLAQGCTDEPPPVIVMETMIEAARFGYMARAKGHSWTEVELAIREALAP